MLRLPEFEVLTPTSVSEVIEALQVPGTRIVAGGTDILPNLKHRLDQPSRLVSLARLTEFRGVKEENDVVKIGSGMTLTQVATHPVIRQHFPSLADAASRVASPVIRNMGTLGGNVNLDTRCRYVNQTEFWRVALGGGCLKSEGNVCHVVPGGKNCVAAMSADTVPALISLGASAVLVGPQGPRTVELADYFTANGVAHTKRGEHEVMTEIHVPKASGPRRAAYFKWSVRKSIDFPLISLALAFDLEADRGDAAIRSVKLVVGVLNSKPREVSGLETLIGKSLASPEVSETCAAAAHKQCKPLTNVPYDAEYRRKMIPVYVRRAIAELVEGT
jgi:4-hydroxybenzoyl-CoA reductase subunit beta